MLVDCWFRMEIDGWENVPRPPALLVGIHSGTPFVWDAWTVGLQWWRRLGQDRPQPSPPAKIRTRFVPAVELDHDPARAADADYVDGRDREVEAAIQEGMDALARKRALPLCA